jgi:hypothetical protein
MPDDSIPHDMFDRWDEGMMSESDPMPLQLEGIVPLGHDHGTFYYLSRAAGQVAALSASQHTKQNALIVKSVATWDASATR